VGGETDVCVDFVAPAKPGRYISYWRLTSPDLQTFGQRVWVLIQVEQPVQTSGKNDTSAINLNLPADCNPITSKLFMVDQPVQNSGNKQTAAMNLNLPAAEGSTTTCTDSASDSDKADEEKINYSDVVHIIRSSIHKGSKAVASVVPCAPPGVVAMPITPHTSSTGAVVMPADVPAPEAAPLSVPAPVPAAAPVNSRDTPVSVPASPSPDEVFSAMEEKLLRELAGMGFRQVDLNKEVLRENEYDLQKSVDDLCGFHEWDPLLVELKELVPTNPHPVHAIPAKDLF
jgi:next-to-BRCA1 protein 1